ncbi:TPA: glycosyltransferase family 4 protein [Escherichia coli]|uniref:glycosyltransferase family 4 protein n=1 Tax=Enterobacteriaceae TaxID=543 RepID=UPI0015637709|nr:MULTISPECIES: glycosyltransferase family 4 protein [Enterobacteriaceae]EKR7174018.1 glycosyltransferase family 4 protein [Escherichia coli]ELR7769519.1 glycosyltransferase family 4 protein [Escherichia coli]MBN6692377.1 glycosyltransferase family 4 protein [Escherichia coli]MDP4344451.1 glycosyltransferase family 4 protein [Escherichia coli]MDP4370535.1 glycosyltransferase family 4 protein [Escherichia coli]
MESLENQESKLTGKKKLCYFVNSDWYFELHWLERALASLKSGYEVHLITKFDDIKIKKNLESKGIICHHSKMEPLSLNPGKFIFSASYIFYVLKKINPDIIHCITIKPCIIGGIFARWFNKSLVLSVVGLGRVFDCDEPVINFVRQAVILGYKHVVKNQKAYILFEHENDKNRLANLLAPVSFRSKIIDGAGIDINSFNYTEEVVKEKKIVLFASRLLWSKGLKDLVYVKKMLEQEGVLFSLNVAGIPVPGDPDSIPLETIESWASDGTITWLGKCQNINELIQEANIVALPSSYAEGIPRILIEAASSGRACISYDTGGCSSLIYDGQNGFVVEKNNVDDLMNKLCTLLQNDALREKMGRKGREIVIERFSSERVIKATLGIYDLLVCNPRESAIPNN